jgi:hypothetical protein
MGMPASKSGDEMSTHPQQKHPEPPLPEQQQDMPGYTEQMNPRPDHGEQSYVGSGKLKDGVALITGADSWIGRAVAIAYAREGADIIVSYLEEDEDAQATAIASGWAARQKMLHEGRRQIITIMLPGELTEKGPEMPFGSPDAVVALPNVVAHPINRSALLDLTSRLPHFFTRSATKSSPAIP